jgi:hypothetical protein
MQLRVARLCLDCEEIFVGDVCPVCASSHSAFLSNWLPVEERRRWRRPAQAPAAASAGRLAALRQILRNIFGDGTPVKPSGPPRTRRADHIPAMNFDAPAKDAAPEPRATDPRPIRGDAR